MPYVGGSLTEFFDEKAQKVTTESARRMADKAILRWHEVTKMNTPVRTGVLRESWYVTPANKKGGGGEVAYETQIRTDVSYAAYVEHGTGLWGPSHSKYLIEPKTPGGVLHWIDPKSGGDVFARRVLHPGSPGQHMVVTGGAITEHEAQGGLFRAILAEWAKAWSEGVRG